MDKVFLNHEGYRDPTPALAMRCAGEDSSCARFPFSPVVYIASPYAGDTKYNTMKARRYCRFAVSRGCIPIAPHLLFPQFMDEDADRDRALFFDRVILSKCAELWVMGDTLSPGMKMEIKQARARNMVIRHFSEEDLR